MTTSRYGSAPSPFLAGSNLQFAWDSTSIGYAKECLRKYFYTMIEGWRAKSESVHLTFGIHFHKAFEYYDGTKALGATHDEAVLKTLRMLLEDTWDRSPTDVAGEPWSPEHPSKTRETLIRSVLWYLEEYRDDTAKTLILSNGKPAVELSFSFGSGVSTEDGTEFVLSGHMDRMVAFNGDSYVMDHKTSGSPLSAYYFSQYQPDNQMSLYTLAGKVVYNTPVSGVIIDAAQIAVGFTNFARGITMRSAGQLDEWLEGFAALTSQVERIAARPDSHLESAWPMNEKSCGAYGGCVFRKVCSVDRAVRPNYLKTDFEIRHWNPLETR